jgi:hypothetical protein
MSELILNNNNIQEILCSVLLQIIIKKIAITIEPTVQHNEHQTLVSVIILYVMPFCVTVTEVRKLFCVLLGM